MNLTRKAPSQNPEILVILDTGIELRGEIVNISSAGINLRIPVHFEAGAAINFRVRDCCSTRGKVAFCRPDGGQYLVALSIIGEDDRRAEPRFSTDQAILLKLLADETLPVICGRLIDVSRSGVGLQIKSPVAVGALVEIRAETGVIFGEVRSCMLMPNGAFRVGVFAEETFAVGPQ